MTRTLPPRSPLRTLSTFVLLFGLAPSASAAPRVPAYPVRAVSSLPAAGASATSARRPAAPLVNGWVAPNDTFPLFSHGFQDLAGGCNPRGWSGEDRSALVFGHVSDRFVINQDIFGGLGTNVFVPIPGYPAEVATTRFDHPGAVAVDDSGCVSFAQDKISIAPGDIIQACPGDPLLHVRGPNPASGWIVSMAFDPVTRAIYAITSAGQVHRYDPGSGTGVLVAGALSGPTADSLALLTRLVAPKQLAVDGAGNVYWAEFGLSRVRMLRRNDQRIVTVAGNGVSGYSGDGGPATAASLNSPTGVAWDGTTNRLDIVDANNNVVREVDLATGLITTLPATPGAFEANPVQCARSNGVLFVSDGHQVFRYDGAQFLRVVGGGDWFGPSAEASLGTRTLVTFPTGLTGDGAGGIYFGVNQLVLHLNSAGALSTVAGVPVSMRMGQRAFWFGADASSAPQEVATWVQDHGYGNDWSQRLTSPSISLVTHPNLAITFDVYAELQPATYFNEPINQPLSPEFVSLQAQKADGSWIDVSTVYLRRLDGRDNSTGGPVYMGGAFKATARLDGLLESGIGLSGTTHFRILVQTGRFNSNEDGAPPNSRGAGVAIVDNIAIQDGGVDVIPRADFEDGTTNGWTASALNSSISVNDPVWRDLPPAGTNVQLQSGFDFADPSCAWTFTSSGGVVTDGTLARLTSPWFARVPGQDAFTFAFSGKLSTLEEGRVVTFQLRGKNAGESRPHAEVPGFFALNAGPGPGDLASPFFTDRLVNYPLDFSGSLTADSLQLVIQAEDWAEAFGDPLTGRPVTRLPFLDDFKVFQTGVDRDFDGVADAVDLCPDECAAGQDANADGCIDANATMRHVESWPAASLPLHFRLSQDGDPAIADGSDLTALRFAFAAWQAVDGDSLPMVEDPVTTQKLASATDGINLVTFQDDEPFDPDVIAVTPTLSFTKRTAFGDRIVMPGEIVDADMIFNPTAKFATPSHTGDFDLRSVAAHEAGHFLGLSHTGVADATMFYVLQSGTNAASLEPDDQAAIAAAYPSAKMLTTYGAIRGVVRRGSNLAPIPGALVTAVPLDATDNPTGSPVASDFSAEDGSYALRRLPAGRYGVYVEPLDGRDGGLTPNYISERVNLSAQTNFDPEWWSAPETAVDDPSGRTAIVLGPGERRDSANVVTNIDTTAPFVESVSPPADSTGIRIDATIVVRFSEPIADTTLRRSFHVFAGPDTVTGTAALAAGLKTLIFSPSNPLHFGTVYTVLVRGTVTDRQGVPIGADFTSPFTTQEQTSLSIADVQPRSAPRGGLITVIGTGFDPLQNPTVKFSFSSGLGSSANPVLQTPTSLVVRVPNNAITGDCFVTQPGFNNASNRIRFTVLQSSPQVPPSPAGGELTANFAPTDVAVAPGGNMVYAVGDGGITSIGLDPNDVANYRVSRRRAIGNAKQIALMPDGRRGYVTMPDLAAVVEVITDPVSGLLRTPIDTIPVDGAPDGITIAPSGRRAFVTVPATGTIVEIDTDPGSSTRNEVLRSIPTPGAALNAGIGVGPLGGRVYFSSTNAGGSALLLADAAVAQAHGSGNDGAAAVTPDEGMVLFPDPVSARLLWSIIGSDTFYVPHELLLGGAPRDVAINREGQSAFVVTSTFNQLEMVDITNAAKFVQRSAVGTGSNPVAVAISRDSNVVAVANYGGRSVSVYTVVGNGLSLRGTFQAVTSPGDMVAVQSDSTGPGTLADLGRGAFPVDFETQSAGIFGVAFRTPPSEQRDANLSLQFGPNRSLAAGLPILDHIEHPVPLPTTLQLPLDPAASSCQPGSVLDISESPDGGLLAATWNSSTPGCDLASLTLFDTGGRGSHQFGLFLTSSLVSTFVGPNMGRRLCFSPDGTQLWVTRDHEILIYDAVRSSPTFGTSIAAVADLNVLGARTIAADPLGRFMYVGAAVNNILAVYRYRPAPAPLPPVILPAGPSSTVDVIAPTPDGRYVLATAGGALFVVDPSTGAVVTSVAAHPGSGNGVSGAVNADGRRALVAWSAGTVSEINLDPAFAPIGQELFYGPIGPFGIDRVFPAPDGRSVLAFRNEGPSLVQLDLQPVPPGVSESILPPASNVIRSADGRRLWSAQPGVGGAQSLHLFDFVTASSLSLVAGADQVGPYGSELPQPITVRVTNGNGAPAAGVAVQFDVSADATNGALDSSIIPGALSLRRLTDANGEAHVAWSLPLSGGSEFTLTAMAYGIGGAPLVVHSSVAVNDSTLDPVIVELGPPDGSTGLAAGTGVFARFNQRMDLADMANHLTLTANGSPVPGAFSGAEDNRTVIFQPSAALPFLANAVLQVSAGALDREGNVLATGGTSHFTVQAQPPLAVSAIDPPAAPPSSVVTLIGSGFSPVPALNTVTFAGGVASVVTASAHQLSVVVPHTAITGNVVVQANSATSSPVEFTVLPANPDPGGLIGSLPAAGGVRDIAITPDGTRAYVTNPSTNNVAALDIQHAVGLASIPVGLRPQGVDILATGKRAYVTNTGSNDVSVIDVDPLSPAYNTVVNTITVGKLPVGIVARGQKVYVLNTGAGTLDVIDADPGHATYDHIVASGNTGSTGGGGVDVSGDGGLAYASTAGGISVIDLKTNPPSLRDTIAIPTGTISIAIRPNQSSALALALDGTLYVIDIVPGSPNENKIVASGNTGSKGGGTVDVSGDGTLAYVSNPDGNVVYVFQLVDGVAGQAGAIRPGSIVPGPAVTLVPLTPIAVGSGPAGIATDPLGRFTLVVNSGSGTVSIIGFSTSLPPVAAEFDFDPNTLNLSSHGRWVTGYLEPAPPRTASEIDVSSIRLNGVVPVASDAPTAIGDHDSDGIPDLMVKFPRAAVELLLPAGDAVPVTVTGTIGPRTFEGHDTVKVKRAKMLAPVANQVLAPNHAYELRWEVPGGTKSSWVAVLHSFDRGVSWFTDAMHIANSGKFNWMAPDTIADSVRVAVVQVESEDPASGEIEGVLAESEPFHISGTTSVEAAPSILSFARVQPNPARGLARMRFGLPARANVQLDVFDVLGRHVRSLARGERDPGWYSVEWRGETDGGGRIGAGVYFARFRAAGREIRQRFTLLE